MPLTWDNFNGGKTDDDDKDKIKTSGGWDDFNATVKVEQPKPVTAKDQRGVEAQNLIQGMIDSGQATTEPIGSLEGEKSSAFSWMKDKAKKVYKGVSSGVGALAGEYKKAFTEKTPEGYGKFVAKEMWNTLEDMDNASKQAGKDFITKTLPAAGLNWVRAGLENKPKVAFTPFGYITQNVFGIEPLYKKGLKKVGFDLDEALTPEWEKKLRSDLAGKTEKLVDNINQKRIESIKSLGITDETSAFDPVKFSYNLTSGASSMALGVGVGVVTKSPTAAAIALAGVEGSSSYDNARKAGKDPDEALKIASVETAGIALLERIGYEFMFKNFSGSKLYSASVKSVTETLQEESQTLWQNMVEKVGYDPERKITEGLVETALYTFPIGFIAGGTIDSLDLSPNINEKITVKLNPEIAQDVITDAQKQIADTKIGEGKPELAEKLNAIDVESIKSWGDLYTKMTEQAGGDKQALETIKNHLQTRWKMYISEPEIMEKNVGKEFIEDATRDIQRKFGISEEDAKLIVMKMRDKLAEGLDNFAQEQKDAIREGADEAMEEEIGKYNIPENSSELHTRLKEIQEELTALNSSRKADAKQLQDELLKEQIALTEELNTYKENNKEPVIELFDINAMNDQKLVDLSVIPYSDGKFGLEINASTQNSRLLTLGLSSDREIYNTKQEAIQAGVGEINDWAKQELVDLQNEVEKNPTVEAQLRTIIADTKKYVDEKTNETIEALKSYIFYNKRFTPAIQNKIEKLNIKPTESVTLYRDGDFETKRPSSWSYKKNIGKNPISKTFTPAEILVDTTDSRFRRLFTGIDRESLLKYNNLEGEVIVKPIKSQKDIVQEVVKEKPKSIKEIAEETGILEPNVRRILGVGAKTGTFERVEKGVYILSKGKEDIAYIQTGDAKEVLAKMAKEGKHKFDMAFLDPPYKTSGVTGGNRGINFETLSPQEMKNDVIKPIRKMMKTKDSPVVYMYSNSKSGWSQMKKYNDVIMNSGLKLVAEGKYTKTYKSGKPMKFGKYTMPPEGILIFNESGKSDKLGLPKAFEIKAIAPLYKGHYQTEKAQKLLEQIIKGTTKKGDTVLDPFAGSGVTGEQAVKSGRKTVVIEKSKKAVEEHVKPRIKKAVEELPTSKQAKSPSTGYASMKRWSTSELAKKRGIGEVNDEQFLLSEEAKKILSEFGVPIAEKHLTGRYLGVYKPQAKKVRVQSLYNVTVVVHEATHAIDDKHSIATKIMTQTGRNSAIQRNLTDIYATLYPTGKESHPLRKRMVEGLATFIENYFYDPKGISQKYPVLVDNFIKPTGKFYNKDITKLLQKMNGLMDKYAKLSPEARIGARIRTGKEVVSQQKGFTFAQRAVFELFNKFEPLKRYSKKLGVTGTWDDPTVQAFNIMNKNTIVLNWVKGDSTPILKSDGNFYNEKGTVQDYLKLIKGREKEFSSYLIARRVVADHNKMTQWQNIYDKMGGDVGYNANKKMKESALKELEKINKKIAKAELEKEGTTNLAKQKKRIRDDIKALNTDIALMDNLRNNIESVKKIIEKDDFSIQDAGAVINKYKEKFEKAGKIYDSINKKLIIFSNETGLLKPETARKYLREEGYTSFRRYIDDEISGSVGTISTNSRTKVSSFKERTGSELDIIDPIYTQIMSINEVISKGMENVLWKKVYDLSKKDTEIARRFETLEVIPSVDGQGKVSFPQEKDPNVIRIFDEGKRIFVKAAPEFLAVAKTLKPKEVDGFVKLLRIPSSIFTRLTTSANPFFAFGNLTIDQVSALMQTETGFKPVVDPAKSFVDFMTKDKVMKDYFALGGKRQTLASFHDLSPEEIENKLTGGQTKYEKVAGVVDSGLNILEMPSNASEFITRFAEYRRALKKGFNQSEAMYKAMEVTIPFQLHGNLFGRLGVEFIKSIPYLNAAIQVMYKFGRTTKSNPTRVATVGAGLMATALTFAIMIMKGADDKTKRQLAETPVSELARAIFIPNPFGDGLIRIRIPEQFGTFIASAELFVFSRYNQNKNSFNDYLEAMTSWLPDQLNVFEPKKMALGLIPQVFKPSALVAVNKKVYPDVLPIVPYYMEVNNSPEDQYDEYTSKLAVGIGKILGVSPKKVDFWVSQQFGAVGGYAINLKGKMGGDTLLGQFERKIPVFRQEQHWVMMGRSYNNFYEQKELVTQQWNSAKDSSTISDDDKYDLKIRKKVYDKTADVLSDMRKLTKTGTTLPENVKSDTYSLLLEIDDMTANNVDSVIDKIFDLKDNVNKLK